MNISFFDGVNDGKFYSINAGKYDELGEEDIDILEGVNEEIEDEDDADTCLNRFAALEKDASKIHMNLNNLRNEFKGSCKDWNNLSDTVDHMLNGIAELRTIMNKADDRLNKRLNVISEANVVLTDKLNLVEKKLEVFKCIDILDRVTKLEEKFEKLEGKYTTCHNSNKLAIGRLYERLGKVEPKLAETAKIVEAVEDKVRTVDTINGTISGYDYAIMSDKINELESKLGKFEEHLKPAVLEETKEVDLEIMPSVLDDILDRLGKLEEKVISTQLMMHSIDLKSNALEKRVNENLDWKDLTGTTVYESIKNDILDSIKRLEEDGVRTHLKVANVVSNDIQSDAINHPKHYTDGKYECIDFIEEYGMVTHIGNTIKYISRNGKKDTSKYAEDLNKAFWYLHRYNTPQSMGHINAIDYCHEKKLPIELANVIVDISHEEYKHAEELLGDYIVKITGKTPKALEDEQSK